MTIDGFEVDNADLEPRTYDDGFEAGRKSLKLTERERHPRTVQVPVDLLEQLLSYAYAARITVVTDEASHRAFMDAEAVEEILADSVPAVQRKDEGEQK